MYSRKLLNFQLSLKNNNKNPKQTNKMNKRNWRVKYAN